MVKYASQTFTRGPLGIHDEATDWLNSEPAGFCVAIGASSGDRFTLVKRLETLGRPQIVAELRGPTVINRFLDGANLQAMGAVGDRSVVVKSVSIDEAPEAATAEETAKAKKPRKKGAKKTAEKEVVA